MSSLQSGVKSRRLRYPGFRVRRLLPAAVLLLGGARIAAGEAAPGVQMMQAFKVSATRLNPADTTGAGDIEDYDASAIDDSGAFTVDEFLDTLPPTEGKTLVLVDGVPTYLDIASLPLDMIQSIEVSRDGAMPQYGAYSSGVVINIRLKKNYVGGSVMGRAGGSFSGGAGHRSLMVSGATTHGKVRAFFSFKFDRTDRLPASARALSRTQDHIAQGGHDLRVAWGSPATVVAVNGPLDGVTDAAGAPVSTALVPAGQNGSGLTPADFIAGGARRFNTSPYLSLISPGTRQAANLGLNYRLTRQVNVSLTASALERRSDQIGAPPVLAPSASTLVPAAFNPFGQDVEIGTVLVGFGPTHQDTVVRTDQIGLHFNGWMGQGWRWNAGGGFRHNENDQRATDLDTAKFTAALQAADPAQRFNPFADPAAGDVNARLYPALTVVRTRHDATDGRSFEAGVNGPVLQAPGGPVNLSLHGSWNDQQRELRSSGTATTAPSDVWQQTASESVSIGGSVPIVGRKRPYPGVHRLELQGSSQWAWQTGDGGSQERGLGLVWSPWSMLYLRARQSTDTESPRRSQIIASDSLVPEILLDPRRPASPATDVRIVTQDTIVAAAERTDRTSVGVGLDPEGMKGLHVAVDYMSRRQSNILENNFDPQDIIDNEAAFPGRVVRAPATAADLAAGQPGPILSVDTTPGNAGRREERDLHFSAYFLELSPALGRVRIGGWAEHPLQSLYEVQPGVAFIHSSDHASQPPKWRMHGLLAWSRRSWNAGASVQYVGGTPSDPGMNNAIPATTQVDFRIGYEFRRWAPHPGARGVRVALDLGNIFNAQGTWADTVSGYRGGSLIGRTYNLTVSVPL